MDSVSQPVKRPFTSASRAEIAAELQVLEGQIPSDLYGHVFLNAPCGSVNGPTPAPQYHPDGSTNGEWGDTLFNGDAMLFRFDLDQPGKISVKSGLLRTPCYWADEATKYGSSYFADDFYFKSMGIARTSFKLGVRNQVNTALTPFKFSADSPTRFTVNFDAGRPFEVGPASLSLKTAIGYNAEWLYEFPALLQYTFPMVQSSAHPSFDPVTREFYTVCFQKSLGNLLFNSRTEDKILAAEQWAVLELQKLERWLGGIRLKGPVLVGLLRKFMDFLHQKLDDPAAEFAPHEALDAAQTPRQNPDEIPNSVTILRWTGEGALQRWNVLDAETGQNLVIEQTMHQTNFSRDYLVLVDSSLKFSLDILENVPFPDHPEWNAALRWIFRKVLEPETPLYLVRRADLQPGVANVVARKFTVPLETVHYSINYENPNDQVTIHTAHNTANCAAEWIRPYDFLATAPDTPALPNTYGLPACGEMDIGRIGKFVVQGSTGAILSQQIILQKGFENNDVAHVKAHTWGVALNTYRDIVSADRAVGHITYNFWQTNGLDYRMLTRFMQDLYADYPNRAIPVDDLLAYTRYGIPYCLVRQNADTMELEDYFLFQKNQNFRSMHFLPRYRAAGETAPVHEQLDGYILCTMVNGSPTDLVADAYTCEIWLFDAAQLGAGPVCKLHHPDLDFSFTIHSAWSPDCQEGASTYNVSVRADYDQVLSQFWDPEKRAFMADFLQKNVYPHYEQPA